MWCVASQPLSAYSVAGSEENNLSPQLKVVNMLSKQEKT